MHPKELRENAAKCRALSSLAKTEYMRTELRKMSEKWDQLASDQEVMLTRWRKAE